MISGEFEDADLGPTTSDADFVAMVRRYRPSSLVPLVARVASEHMETSSWMTAEHASLYAPWLLAEVARVSLAHGNEFRQPATLRSVAECTSAVYSIVDPELASNEPGSLAGFMLRMSEQLEFQTNLWNEMSRTAALFDQTSAGPSAKVLRPGWQQELFGAPLIDFVGAGQLLHFAHKPNAGTFDPSWMSLPHLSPLVAVMDPGVLTRVWEHNYVTDVRGFCRANGRPASGPWRRFDFNPLAATPVITDLMDGGRWVIPSPGLLARRFSPLGVYYAGTRKWGKDFSDDLGALFEAYVGRQLNLLPGSRVLPAVRHGRNNSSASVDWIVILPEVVLMVEVKSVRPTDQVRRGGPEAARELDRMLGKAFRQLHTTNALIAARDPAFLHIPDDRPRVGLVVTMETFHTVNSPFHRDMYRRHLDFPALVAGANELEHFVSLRDDSPGQVLQHHVDDVERDGWSLKSALTGRAFQRNTVLAQAWDTYPWSDLRE